MHAKTKVDELREMMEKKAAAAEAAAPVAAEATAADPLADLQTRVEQAEAAAREQREERLRTLAEFDNFRKRTERDKSDAITFANERILHELMPVLDHLEMALASIQQPGEPVAEIAQAAVQRLSEGVELTFRQFLSVLNKFGFAEIPVTLGAPFDPSIHEAIAQVDAENAAPGTIVTIHRRGYTLNTRLLRAVLVVVAK